MTPRWKHPCDECTLIAQSARCDIYRCPHYQYVFRHGEGPDNVCHLEPSDIMTAAKIILDTDAAALIVSCAVAD